MKNRSLAICAVLAAATLTSLYCFRPVSSVVAPAKMSVASKKKKETDIVSASSMSATIDESAILRNAPNMSPDALKSAIKGYEWSVKNGGVSNPNVLTIVDLSKPSYEKRLWVVNLSTSQVLMNVYTTQGKNSGLVTATSFSNRPGSDQSSLGVYKTLSAYQGKHGTSLRLQGLEKGLNDNAYGRAIVIHAAPYASPEYVAENHRTGRSWGCFAVDPAVSKQLVNLTKNGSVIFAYAPAEKYDARLESI